MNSSLARPSRSLPSLLGTLLFLASASAALAHPGHGPEDGFTPGFVHPFTGWDHVLAMIAVGLWAAQLRATRVVPAAFVALMAVGGAIGYFTGTVPGIDQAIAASVLVLGLLVARTSRLPVPYAAALAGLFACFHGMAHGAEMPATAGGFSYGVGFVAATVLLLAAGVALGSVAQRRSAQLPRLAGWAIAAAGFALVLS